MEWSDIGKIVMPMATIAGEILTGNIPGAALTVGKLIAGEFGSDATPDAVHAALMAAPDAQVKLAGLQARLRVDLERLAVQSRAQEIAAETNALQTVNATMQAEAANAANENWFQKGWRPFNGYVVGIASLAGVIGVIWAFFNALAWGQPEGINAIPTMASSLALILGVPGAAVGITAWHRGQLQREQAAGSGAGPAA